MDPSTARSFGWPAAIVVLLGSATIASGACSTDIESQGTGGASSSSSSASSSSSSASSSSSSASSSGASSSSSSASSSSSSSASSSSASSSSGATCSGACTTHADCQALCPDVGPDMQACCNIIGCYVAPSCPAPCVPGAACQPNEWCFGNRWDPNNCVVSCSCDATGHYACVTYDDLPSCPAVHPACGDPCDPSAPLYCMCAVNGGATSCKCDAATSTWACEPLCGLFDSPPTATCTDFTVGQPCGDVCECVAGCGTQVWACTI